MDKKQIWVRTAEALCLVIIMGVLMACGTTGTQTQSENVTETMAGSSTEMSVEEERESTEDTVTEESVEMTQEPILETVVETEEVSEDPLELPTEVRVPAGHRTIYSDGEVYGWTRYEYDELGRKEMVIFITPRGDEYWSPVFYDGQNHVIPEVIGDWSTLDENGLYVAVGTEDSRGRQNVTAQYEYDQNGNLTDYWYMHVNDVFLRHIVYSYDAENRLVRMELYNTKNDRCESRETYAYSQGRINYKVVTEDVDREGSTIYTYYRYDAQGRLIREEQVWGGEAHDYVQYTYNEIGELLSEYHYLEDPMMGGSYTIEYLYEWIDDSAG